MLTPTGVTASAYWNAIKAGNRTHARMTFTGQNIVLDDSDIYLNTGINVNEILNSNTDIAFGNAVSKQINTTILNSSNVSGLDWTGEFKLEFGVEIGNPAVTNWVTIGYFIGEKPKNINHVKQIKYTAYDRMKKFDVLADDFFDAITYPITVQQIYDDLCTFVGVQNVSGDELPNAMSRSYASAPVDMVGYTCRDILSWIAQACGCYARITADGNVKMVWFADHTSDVNITATDEFKFECADEEIDAIDRVVVKAVGSDLEAQYPASVEGNTYTIIDNPFLAISSASDITDFIQPIYDRLDTFGVYLPCSLQCIGNWLVETGDIISVDIDGSTVSVPLFVRTLTWRGGVVDSYEATGNKNRSPYGTDKDKQKVLSSKEIKLIVGDRYYEKKSGIVIDQNGVSISASKALSIESGGTIDIDTTNMTLCSDEGYFSITYQEFLLNHIFEVGKNLYHVYTQDSPYSSVMSFIQAPGESRQISGQTTIVKYNGLQIHMENAYNDGGITKYYGGNINFAVTRGTWYEYSNSQTLYTVSFTPSRTSIDTNAYFALGTSEYPWHYAYITTINSSYIHTGNLYSPSIHGSSSNSLTNGITLYPHKGTSSYIRVRADNVSTPTKFTFSSDVNILFDGEAGSVAWANVTGKPSTYTPPLAANGTRGGIQIGYTASGKNYPVQLSNEKAYVNVPWTNTTYAFSNSAPTLAWNTTSTVGVCGGVALTVKMPTNPNTNTTYSFTDKNPTLAWSTKSTVGVIAGGATANFCVTMPANPDTNTNTWKANSSKSEGYVASGSGKNSQVWKTDASGNPAWRADANTNTTYSFSNSAPTLAWNTTSTVGVVGGTALTVKMPANPNTNTTYAFSNGNPTLAWGTKSTVGTAGGVAFTATMPANPNTNSTANATKTSSASAMGLFNIYKSGNVVRINFNITSGVNKTTWESMATIPSGYRPAVDALITCVDDSTMGSSTGHGNCSQAKVTTGGAFQIWAPKSAHLYWGSAVYIV